MLKNILKTIYVLVACFYWLPFYATLLWFFGKKYGSKDRHAAWSRRVSDFLGIKYNKLSGSQPVNAQRTVFLVNHRSQADFFIHDVILEYAGNVLSRYAVAIIFPLLYFMPKGTVWYFKRGSIRDFEKFNGWLDSCFLKTDRKSLWVYPEGHRMYKATSVEKIKYGMIKYAYSRKYPVQIAMSFGNEDVLNEKQFQVSFDRTVHYCLDGVIDPKDFLNEADFISHVEKRFKEYFVDVYKKAQAEGSYVLKDNQSAKRD